MLLWLAIYVIPFLHLSQIHNSGSPTKFQVEGITQTSNIHAGEELGGGEECEEEGEAVPTVSDTLC